jgi:hypothetical protein
LELITNSNVQDDNETFYFETCNKYETPHVPVVYFEKEDLEFLSLYDICMTFQNIFSSSHDICMTCKCSPIWDETSCVLYYKNEILESIALLYDIFMTCDYYQKGDRNQSTVYYETKLFKIVSSTNEKCITYKHSQERCKTCEFKNKTPMHRCFQHFNSCSIFSTISECNNLEFSFHCNVLERHDYVIYWPEQYLIYISAFIICNYCILTRGRRGGKTKKKKTTKKNH